MARPIFVMGSPRSGTTGLANALCQHKDIAGVQSSDHQGIHESHFFSLVKDRYGDISIPSNFVEFLEAFSASDYFTLTGIKKETMYLKRPKTYEEFFRILMDEFARKQGTNFWLEKTPHHSVYIYEIAQYYPNSRFIIIKRDLQDTIKSDIKLHYNPTEGNFAGVLKLPRPLLLGYLVFRYHMFYKHLESFCKKHQDACIIVEFSDFVNSKELVLKRICKFLDIPFDPKMVEERYGRNTSFSSETERKRVLKPYEKAMIIILDKIARILPFTVYHIIAKYYKKKLKTLPYPQWFYSIRIREMINVNKRVMNNEKDNDIPYQKTTI